MSMDFNMLSILDSIAEIRMWDRRRHLGSASKISTRGFRLDVAKPLALLSAFFCLRSMYLFAYRGEP